MGRLGHAALVLFLYLPAAALSQGSGKMPSEAPPEGFSGLEYFDSSGCSFMRARIAAEVIWVPRYGPDRQQICHVAARMKTEVSETAAPAIVLRPVSRPDGGDASSDPAAGLVAQGAAAGDDQPAETIAGDAGAIDMVAPDEGPIEAPPATGPTVQVASFLQAANAERLRAQLNASGLPATVGRWRNFVVVSAGPFHGKADAQAALAQVRALGFRDAILRP